MPFGRIHMLDMQDWNGKTDRPDFQQLLIAIDKLTNRHEEVPTKRKTKSVKKTPWKTITSFILISIVAIAGYYLWQEKEVKPKTENTSPESELRQNAPPTENDKVIDLTNQIKALAEQNQQLIDLSKAKSLEDQEKQLQLAKLANRLKDLESKKEMINTPSTKSISADLQGIKVKIFTSSEHSEQHKNIIQALDAEKIPILIESLIDSKVPENSGVFSDTPTIFYYTKENITKANQLATYLQESTGYAFKIEKGDGIDIPINEMPYLLVVHFFVE